MVSHCPPQVPGWGRSIQRHITVQPESYLFTRHPLKIPLLLMRMEIGFLTILVTGAILTLTFVGASTVFTVVFRSYANGPYQKNTPAVRLEPAILKCRFSLCQLSYPGPILSYSILNYLWFYCDLSLWSIINLCCVTIHKLAVKFQIGHDLSQPALSSYL